MANKLISNLLSSSNFTNNLIIGVSLVIILLLVYLKNNNFELFSTSTTLSTITNIKAEITEPNIVNTYSKDIDTISLFKNDIIKNSNLVNFINKFIINKNKQKIYSSTLSDRQGQINNLSTQVINLINPS